MVGPPSAESVCLVLLTPGPVILSRMKFLLSCVNSPMSLVGYDWEEERVFWQLPSSAARACSACYDGSDLLIATDNFLRRYSGNGCEDYELKGKYDAYAHTVRVVGDDLVGIADTGNTQLLFINREGSLEYVLRPLEVWGDYPIDAIHLNDFAATPFGILASCFGYRPWREIIAATSWEDWSLGGYGLIMNLNGGDNKGVGRIVGCGLDQPHSVRYVAPNWLYVSSSATGVLHVCEITATGLVQERHRYQVTRTHFLRGALRSNSGWFLGGSCFRHGPKQNHHMEIYDLDESSGGVTAKRLELMGEIYDILPWHDDILRPLIARNFPDHARFCEDHAAGSLS